MSFEGEIGEIDLIQRLVELGGEQFTGAIRFESDGIIKIVYFKGGDVLSASTNDRTDAIDEILLRANKVSREHVKQALAKRKESETLGDALLGLGFITRKELTWARRVQVIGVLRSIIGWKTGSYTIVADYLPKREEGTLFPLAQIIVELVVTDNDRSKSEQAMDSGNAVFEKAANFDDAFRRLGLNEDAEQIVAQIDGSSTAAEVAGRSGKEVFNVYKLLEALRLLNLLNRADKPPAEHEVYAPSPAGAEWDVENPDFTLDDVAPTVPAPVEQQWAPQDSATMEIPVVNPPAAWASPDSGPKPPSRSVWDESADDDAFTGTELAPPPLAPAAEPQWGFDDAQIEAARRAAVPVHGTESVPTSIDAPVMKPSKPRGRLGLLLTVLVILILAGAAYPAWMWWQDRNAPEPVVVRTPHKPPKLHPPVVATATAPPPTVATTTIKPSPTPAPVTATHAVVVRPAAAAVPPPPAPTNSSTRLQRTATGTTITNTPQPGASSDAVRSRYDSMARDFAAQPGGKYTVQFELVCETTSITRAIAEAGSKVWFVPINYHGRPCYRVFWGRYETSAEASTAAKQLPAGLGATPVVVKIPR
jgi:septal ring-binding cell division protein DamX